VAAWIALAVVMVVAAVVAQAPGLLLIAALTVGYGSVTGLWSRYGMRRVEYTRQLGTDRAVAGDVVDLDVTVWNRKPLPLPWVTADDLVGHGLTVRERPQMDVDYERNLAQVLRNGWALAWYERVVRHFHLDDVRRGAYPFGPVQLRVRDILGRRAVDLELEMPDTLVVAPPSVEVRYAERAVAPLGERRAASSLTADPALFAGIRPFQPGDSLRQIHWRATARLGATVSRRWEPARGRQVVVVIDAQTVDGPHWQMSFDEDAFEELCVVAASLARRLLADGASLGMAAASFAGSPQKFAWLAPRASLGQLTRAGELLARIGPVASAPLPDLLAWLMRRVAPGTNMILLTAREPATVLPALRRMLRTGYGVELVLVGADAAERAAAARRVGISASSAELQPNWEHPRAVAVAG
jgi:uncharacterized protein (DUF58 family)